MVVNLAGFSPLDMSIRKTGKWKGIYGNRCKDYYYINISIQDWANAKLKCLLSQIARLSTHRKG